MRLYRDLDPPRHTESQCDYHFSTKIPIVAIAPVPAKGGAAIAGNGLKGEAPQGLRLTKKVSFHREPDQFNPCNALPFFSTALATFTKPSFGHLTHAIRPKGEISQGLVVRQSP